jgi:nucleotide-binding universal stress UspA family protein
VVEDARSADPVDALTNASARADLVVVGSRGMGLIGSALLGSVSRGVLHHAHCPVAVVRS